MTTSTPTNAHKGQAITPAIGGHYNWIGQPERLVYMGTADVRRALKPLEVIT